MMEHSRMDETLLTWVCKSLEDRGHHVWKTEVSIARIEGDASVRVYYRIKTTENATFILSQNPDPLSCIHQIEVYTFLHPFWPVPDIIAWDFDSGLILQEDAGDILLANLMPHLREDMKSNFYTRLTELWIELNERFRQGASLPPSCLTHALDARQLLFELHFFRQHYLEGFSGLSLTSKEKVCLEEGFFHLIRPLLSISYGLMHRDYHARNVLVNDVKKLYIIDYQDMRIGPLPYDAVSLLYDAYVDIPESVRHACRKMLCDYDPIFEDDDTWFRAVFQRHLKALGTFGYQITHRKQEKFLPAITRVLSWIKAYRAFERFPELKILEHMLFKHSA